MARQLRIEFPGAFYHVTSRGNERKAIFKSQRGSGRKLKEIGTYFDIGESGISAGCHLPLVTTRMPP